MSERIRAYLASTEDNLYRLFLADSPRAYRTSLIGLTLLIAAAVALLVLGGPTPQKANANDTFLLLDSGWRIFCGQRPHLDFYEPLGLASSTPVVVGMWVAGSNASALAYGPAVLFPLITLGTWWYARRRFAAFNAMWIAAMVGSLSICTFSLGWNTGWNIHSYAMLYNRFAWSLLCLLALAVFVEPRAMVRRRAFWEGLGVGVLTCLLILSKVNYLTGAVLVLVVGGLLVRHGRAFWWGVAFSVGLGLAIYSVYMHGDVTAYGRDLAVLRGIQPLARVIVTLAKVLRSSIAELWPLALIVFLQLHPIFAHGQPSALSRPWLRGLALATLVVAFGMVVTVGNAQSYAIPLYVVASLMMVETFERLSDLVPLNREESKDDARRTLRLRVSVGHLAALAAGFSFLAADLGSVAHSFLWNELRGAKAGASAAIASAAMRGVTYPREDGEFDPTPDALGRTSSRLGNFTAIGHARRINDGLELLGGRTSQRSRVYAMDLFNPFPFLLQLPPPRGAPICPHYQRLADDAHHPPAERVFHEVTHVMVPKAPLALDTAAFLERIYGPHLRQHFTHSAESKYWILYVRKPAGG
jgi:hypothetical protein